MDESKTKEETTVHITHEFKCLLCGLHEIAQYKGVKPPFSRNIVLKYPSYVMKDPFSPPGKGEILVLGADCTRCEKPVCISKECSLFYNKYYCLKCALECIYEFPVEIKNKIVNLKQK